MQENVAVVTGGTGGLGRALIPYLVRRDFKVAVTYLIPDEARKLERLGSERYLKQAGKLLRTK